ncbi:terminase large subunit [Companilactobacillus zhachilii]|uniref:terminase large subunit n=1 Tax=Companilactobacillus zhachilii TaxID=2304606 RepID=UPI00403371DA
MIQIELQEYINDILDGEIISCKSVLNAVKRHQRDIERSKDDDFPYIFDEKYAEKVVKFMELLPDDTGEMHKLAGFQKFIIENIYGWVKKDNHDLRRYHKIFVSTARKQGKTLMIAGIILYEFLFGKNPKMTRQIFCTANDKTQAKIAFTMAKKQLEQLCKKFPEIKKQTKITESRDLLTNLNDYSYVRPLSRETGAVDGFNPYLGLLDEYAASKTDEMMGLLRSGQGQQKNPLIVIISTAGFNLNAPMFTVEYPRAKKILKGEITDEKYFAFIAEQESLEEIEDEKNWIKSNPILEVKEVRPGLTEFLRDDWTEAKQTGDKNKVLVKNFNMWRQAEEDSYLDIENWEDTKVDTKPDITGKRVWIGVDVGKTSDLFAISWLVPVEGKWFADSYSFVGTKYGLDAKIKKDRMNYRDLQDKGQCEITKLESGVIDNERVFDWLEQFIEDNDLDVQGICFDPYQYGQLLTLIEKRHPEWEQIQVRQGTMTLSAPTKEFRDAVIEGNIIHSDSFILKTAVTNAIIMSDNNGVRIDKNKYSNKIDALDALLDAYAICFTENIEDYLTDDYIMSDDFGFM